MHLLKRCVAVATFFAALLPGSVSLGQDAWRNGYSVGDQVQFSISGRSSDMQPCTVVENDASSPMRVECGGFKQWKADVYVVYGPDYLSAAGAGRQENSNDQRQAGPTLSPSDFPAFEWRAQYPVGAAVSFTASGRPADAQPCMVSENTPHSVMRVKCKAFKSWRAGEHIVYAPEYISPQGGQAGWDPPDQPAAANNVSDPAGGDAKLGNYACYGSGGAILHGFNFSLLAGDRYADVSGRDVGAYSVQGGDIVFSGGDLDGMRYRKTGPNHYRLGNQASCEPF